ncbi:MAG TPA: hypothetical protein EYP08_00935 [Pyrodictiaceae archaeon]|nr:hypothetical protein [Pyrodictiaceae archaeon]
MEFFEKLIASLCATLALLILLSVARIIRVPGLVIGLAIVLGVLVVAYLLYRIWFGGKRQKSWSESGEIRVRVE